MTEIKEITKKKNISRIHDDDGNELEEFESCHIKISNQKLIEELEELSDRKNDALFQFVNQTEILKEQTEILEKAKLRVLGSQNQIINARKAIKSSSRDGCCRLIEVALASLPQHVKDNYHSGKLRMLIEKSIMNSSVSFSRGEIHFEKPVFDIEEKSKPIKGKPAKK
jgi:hypothetical protein